MKLTRVVLRSLGFTILLRTVPQPKGLNWPPMASEATYDLAFAYLSVPPGGEKEKARVLGYSWRSMMARMAAAPAPSECPTHTTSKSRVSCVQKYRFLAANSNSAFAGLS